MEINKLKRKIKRDKISVCFQDTPQAAETERFNLGPACMWIGSVSSWMLEHLNMN